MQPFFTDSFWNPGSLYKEGVLIRQVVEEARKKIAQILNVTASEVFFTGSGTESDNMAIRGVFEKAKEDGLVKPHIVTTAFEHPALIEVCKKIEKLGGEVTYLYPDSQGLIHSQDVVNALKENTVLVSVMYAHNEIGVVQSIKEISREVKKWKEDRKSLYPYVHTDASQAPNYFSVSVDKFGIDLLTLDAGKIYGPKGIGLLVVKRKVKISPIISGGGQEAGLRSGTENVPSIVGFAKALEIAGVLREKETERVKGLSQYFLKLLSKEIPQAELNGHKEKRLPNNINICIPDLDSEFAVLKLDALGIACAHVTTCKSAGDDSASYAITALGKKECAKSSLRFTLGRGTVQKDIDRAVEALKKILTI